VVSGALAYVGGRLLQVDTIASGRRVLGREVTQEVGGVRTRVDLYAEIPGGQRVFVEVKTGPHARLTPNVVCRAYAREVPVETSHVVRRGSPAQDGRPRGRTSAGVCTARSFFSKMSREADTPLANPASTIV